MTILLIILHVIVCLVLVIVILLQAGRGQGMGGSSFGGGGVQTLFGTKAGDFLTKATSVCAIMFLVTCISLDIIEARRAKSIVRTPGEQAVSQEDIAKIKEALEKLKAEAANQKKDGAATTPATTTAAAPAQETSTPTAK